MRMGSSNDDEQTPTSVRVEVGEVDDGLLAPGVPTGAQSVPTLGKPRRLVIGAIVAAFVIFGLILFNLAPEPGQSADGSPIAPTTSEAPDTTSSPTSTVSNGEVRGGAFADLEIVEQEAFLFDVIKADLGWFAVGRVGGLQEPGLLRSLDGLRWTPVEIGLDDLGTVVGLGKAANTYIAAVDTDSSWTDAGRTGPTGFDVEFFESNDAQTWEPSTRYEPIIGQGIVGPVQINGFAAMAPVRRDGGLPGTGDIEALATYLAPVLEPQQAEAVCSVSLSFDDDVEVSELRTCSGEVLAEVTRQSAPSLFANGAFPEMCVDVLRNALSISLDTELSLAAGGEANVSAPNGYGSFGSVIGETFLAVPEGSFGIDPVEICAAGSGTEPPQPNSVFRWSPGGASTVILPETPADNFAFFGQVVETENGDALIMGETGLMRAAAPFLDWELVPWPELGGGTSWTWSVPRGGHVVVGWRANRLVLIDIDGTILREFDGPANNRFSFVEPILSAEDFVVIAVDSPRRGSVLLKVPYSK